MFILIILTGNIQNGGAATGGAVQHDDGHYQAEQGNNFNSLWSELYPNMNRVNGVNKVTFRVIIFSLFKPENLGIF